MDIYHRNLHCHNDDVNLIITPELSIGSFGCSHLLGSNELKTSVAGSANRISSEGMAHERDNTAVQAVESPDLVVVEGVINQRPYLDIIEAAFLLRQPPCRIRHFTEAGLIPAHALRHDGEICWKFRLRELLDWASEIGVGVSPKALIDLLRLGNESQ